jgi:hypothetical protein
MSSLLQDSKGFECGPDLLERKSQGSRIDQERTCPTIEPVAEAPGAVSAR